ncbi:MAG TPA: TadE/TadG family type IV pilus assembly protein [Marmoricola sp.]|nr:TadE/TadG family type IV pilus assembly protein [Marmoricola sp.]
MPWPQCADRRRLQRGSAVVDFVLVMLILVPLVLGLIQLGLVLHVRNTLVAAASEGSRYGANIDRGPEQAVARTRQQISGALAGRFAEQVTARAQMVDGVPMMVVTVAASVPPLGLWGPGVHLQATGHAVQEQVP